MNKPRPSFRKKGVSTAIADEGAAALRPAPKVALSFDPDEEGAPIKIKKKKKRAHPPPAAPPPVGDAAPALAPAAGTYSSGFLQQLRDAQRTRTGDPAEPAAAEEAAAGGGGGGASVEEIRAAREARERARRAGDEREGGQSFLPLDDAGEDGGGAWRAARLLEELQPEEEEARSGGSGGLVREEQFDEGGVDEMGRPGGGRVTFGEAAGRLKGRAGAVPSAVWRGTDARHGVTVVEAGDDDEEEEVGAGPVGGRSPASAGGGAPPLSSEALAAVAARLAATSFVAATDERLGGQAAALRATLSQQREERDTAQERLAQCAADAAALEGALAREAASFEQLQAARLFTADLLDCLDAKAPAIDALEARLCEAVKSPVARH